MPSSRILRLSSLSQVIVSACLPLSITGHAARHRQLSPRSYWQVIVTGSDGLGILNLFQVDKLELEAFEVIGFEVIGSVSVTNLVTGAASGWH